MVSFFFLPSLDVICAVSFNNPLLPVFNLVQTLCSKIYDMRLQTHSSFFYHHQSFFFFFLSPQRQLLTARPTEWDGALSCNSPIVGAGHELLLHLGMPAAAVEHRRVTLTGEEKNRIRQSGKKSVQGSDSLQASNDWWLQPALLLWSLEAPVQKKCFYGTTVRPNPQNINYFSTSEWELFNGFIIFITLTPFWSVRTN